MVRMEEPSESLRLDRILNDACEDHGLVLVITGWARKTYDIYREDGETRRRMHLIQVESFATRSGEVIVFHDDGVTAAKAIAEALEEAFGLDEAVLVRQ